MITRFFFQVRFVLASIRILFKVANGRWYVFRDEPDWLVAEWATLRIGPDEGNLSIAKKQAFDELMLRTSKVLDACVAQLVKLGDEQFGKKEEAT